MNVDSMSCQQLFNEETSFNEDSLYLTPEATSFTDSVLRKLCDCKSFDALDWLPEKADSHIEPRFENNVSRKIEYESDFALDKENIAGSMERTSTRRHRKSSGARTPLKCIASLSNSIDNNQSSTETLRSNKENDTSELQAKTGVVPQFKKLSERNGPSGESTRCNVLRRMKLLQNLKSKYRNRKENNVSSSSEDVLIRSPKPNYGSISRASELVEKPESSPLQKSDQSSSQISGFPVFMKCRFVQLKRLFRRSVTSLRSCYRKCAQNVVNARKKEYQPLKSTNGGVIHDSTNVPENVDFGNLALQSNLCNMQELLTTVISKLSYVESELKELKNAVKENNSCRSVLVPPPPPIPPPPPPLPSNFIVCSSTPKRKADLTTPENQQLAKRPVRALEQKAQFSITVEELRNVKLRKIGNSVVKKTNVEKSSANDPMPFTPSGRVHGFRYKRNRTVEKDLSEIAKEILSPREKDISSRARLICSPTPSIDRLTNQNIFEQTPKRTKRENSIISRKRKELLDKSPTRKRLNSGGL